MHNMLIILSTKLLRVVCSIKFVM